MDVSSERGHVRRLIFGLTIVLIASGCAAMSPPIRMDASRGDTEVLAGEWYGSYAGDDRGGRRGTIVFKLVAGEDHAHGSVLMIPEGSTRAYERYHGDAPILEGQVRSQMLSIRVVHAGDGVVTGALDTYWDWDRDCPATTTFRGAINDGVIVGTFTTSFGAGVAEATGRWTISRVPGRRRP